jgi:hypothetical protein
MNKETQLLYTSLYAFLKDSIPIIRKNIDISSLPTLIKYRIVKDDNGRIKVQKYNAPNYWQIEFDGLLTNLTSLRNSLIACNKHSQIKAVDGKWSNAFNHGIHFHANYVPIHFLKELIDREKGIKFRKKTFNLIFNNFLKYISQEPKSFARIIIPLDGLNITSKTIKLEKDLRIKKLNPKELVDVINYCSIFGYFYGTGFSAWFKCVLELDIKFKWTWLSKSERNSGKVFLDVMNQTAYIQPKINQEIIILRALINRPISSPTYAIDYREWDYVTFSGGVINYLPWVRSKHIFSEPLPSKLVLKYQKYRANLLNIKDDTTKQRIFVAMRKLAFSMDKPYSGDKLMDAVSGLEGLLVSSNKEVTHKFAERIPLLLEKDMNERKKLQKDLKIAYDLRSQLAHGSIAADYSDTIVTKQILGKKIKNKELSKSKDIQRLSHLLTQLLHKTILLCIDKKTTEFKWDESILGTKINP